MKVIPNNRVANIASAIKTAVDTIIAHDLELSDARTATKKADQQAMAARETALVKLAGTAHNDEWSRQEIKQGIAQALAGRNLKGSTVSTFTSEIKRACKPGIRQHVEALSVLAARVWDAEGETDRKLGRPCRKAFKRRYHMLGRMIGEAAKGRIFSAPSEIVSWAIANDPDLDYEKVAKRLKAIRDQLDAFAKDFPVDGLTTCVEFLDEIGAEELRTCRTAAPATTAPQAAATPVEPEAEAAPQTIAEQTEDALRDLYGEAA